jgi:hypothetical protein
MEYKVIIPLWQNYYEISKKKKAKYWLWKDKEKMPKTYKDKADRHPKIKGNKLYCATPDGEFFIKNTKTVGKPNKWIINGQQLYNGMLHPLLRSKIADYFHTYFSEYIQEQLDPEYFIGHKISVSCDIYEIKRGKIPDVDNLWPIIKWFQDALISTKMLIDDNPDYILESGRKRYYWVEDENERKLEFILKTIK